MGFLRLRLPRLVAIMLACQAAAFLVAPVSLASAQPSPTESCECPGGMGGLACPMHRSPAREARSANDSAVRSTCTPVDAVLLSLGIGLGVLPVSIGAAFTRPVALVQTLSTCCLDHVVPPDPLPPRTRHIVVIS